MYAVLKTGGKQYRVEAGATLVVEKVSGEPGSSITFDRILLVGDGHGLTLGSPTVAGASVSATLLGEVLGPKLVVFKFKQKVKYRRRTGHRQHLSQLRIDSITADGKTVRAEAPKPEAKQAPAAKRAEAAELAEAAGADEKPAPRRHAARDKTAGGAKASSEPKTAGGARQRKTAGEPEPVSAEPEAKPRTRSTRAKASSAETETEAKAPTPPAKPRTRRAARPKTESAKEE